MNEDQFTELRDYAEAADQCIDRGYRPSASLISKGWLREIVRGCWQITPAGLEAFSAVVNGDADLKPVTR